MDVRIAIAFSILIVDGMPSRWWVGQLKDIKFVAKDIMTVTIVLRGVTILVFLLHSI